MKRLAEDDVQTRSFRVKMSMVERPGLAQRSVSNIARADLARLQPGHPEVPRSARGQVQRRVRSPQRQVRDQRGKRRHAGDRRRARHQHAVGRRRRESARRDGRERPAQGHGGVHPGHQPRRSFLPGLRLHRAHLGAAARPLALRDLRALPRDLLQARRGAIGHAVLAARDGPWPDRHDAQPDAARERCRSARTRAPARWTSPSQTGDALRRIDVACRAGMGGDARIRRRRPSPKRSSRARGRVGQGSGRRRAHPRLREDGAGPTAYPLLEAPGHPGWDNWTVPMSMREVEPGVRLSWKTSHFTDDPAWKTSSRRRRTRIEHDA